MLAGDGSKRAGDLDDGDEIHGGVIESEEVIEVRLHAVGEVA